MPDSRQLCTACLELVPVGSPTCPECGAVLDGRASLGKLGDAGRSALERLARDHPARAVRIAAGGIE